MKVKDLTNPVKVEREKRRAAEARVKALMKQVKELERQIRSMGGTPYFWSGEKISNPFL